MTTRRFRLPGEPTYHHPISQTQSYRPQSGRPDATDAQRIFVLAHRLLCQVEGDLERASALALSRGVFGIVRPAHGTARELRDLARGDRWAIRRALREAAEELAR